MKRKVIKQANQAYTITLPINWVRENNINKNSELALNISGKSLIINSDQPLTGKILKLDLSNVEKKEIYRYLIACYAQGIDELEIICNKDVSATITKYLTALIGYALVSQEGNKYLIKDINPGNYPNLDEIFKRVFQMIILFYEAAIKDIFGKQKETLENLKTRDIEVNKFCLYLERAINKMSYEDQVKARTLFTYSFELEKIGDEIRRLWRTNIKHKVKKTPEIKKIIEMSKESLGKAFDSYYQFNNEHIKEIYELRHKVRLKSLALKSLNSHTTRFIRNAVKIVEEAADLSHLTLIKNL